MMNAVENDDDDDDDNSLYFLPFSYISLYSIVYP